MALRPEKIRRCMPDYKKIIEIYKMSFPKIERFPSWMLRFASHFKGVHSVAFYEDDVLCGFSYFLENEDTVFILFLAVDPQIRSKGVGSGIIAWIKNACPGKTIFLDVEKPDERADNNEQRLKRIEFYRRNGILDTGNCFTYDDVTYEILSTDEHLSEAEYNRSLTSYFKVFKKKKRGRIQH